MVNFVTEMRKCNICHILKPLELFPNNKTRPLGKAYNCLKCCNEKRKIHYLKNTEAIKKKSSEYRRNNRKKINITAAIYFKKRSEIDIVFKLSKSIRSMICNSFKVVNSRKNTKAEQILGCTFEFFVSYLEKQFTPEMTWKNKGSYWHIDHIYPISLAKTEEDVIRLNHYTNLRPLEAKENIRKSNKLPNNI